MAGLDAAEIGAASKKLPQRISAVDATPHPGENGEGTPHQMLGIRYPIIQGGVQWAGAAELATAVFNAGSFGIVTALPQPTFEALAKEFNAAIA